MLMEPNFCESGHFARIVEIIGAHEACTIRRNLYATIAVIRTVGDDKIHQARRTVSEVAEDEFFSLGPSLHVDVRTRLAKRRGTVANAEIDPVELHHTPHKRVHA